MSEVEIYSPMLDVSIDERMIKLAISMGVMVSYDSSLWTQEVIVNMKDIVVDERVNFILENIAYIKHKVEPSFSVRL